MASCADPAPKEATCIDRWKLLIDTRLIELEPSPIAAEGMLTEAWRHAALAPGKRVRGMLLLAVLSDLGGSPLEGVDCACALELVHTASLILDDLPCMDDAATRRGRVTLHRKIGESSAILSAIAMLNDAYALAASKGDATIVSVLAKAIGREGLVGGQIMDLHPARRGSSAITETYARKTGALFQAACEIGVVIAGSDVNCAEALRLFSSAVGIAFQIADDTLDHAGDTRQTGKDVGIDRPGSTLASVAGGTAARRIRDMALLKSRSALKRLPRSNYTQAWLDALSESFVECKGSRI